MIPNKHNPCAQIKGPEMYRRITMIAVPALAFMLLCAMDILREPAPWDPIEVGLDVAEKALLVLMVIAVMWSLQCIASIHDDQQAIQDHLARQAARGEDWRAARATEIAAMSNAIAREFQAWGLTSAEIDVASLLLKGASMKEIALARKTSEATIRQQAQSVYRKAGLSGRVELSAYFLDSLLDEVVVDGKSRLSVVGKERHRAPKSRHSSSCRERPLRPAASIGRRNTCIKTLCVSVMA